MIIINHAASSVKKRRLTKKRPCLEHAAWDFMAEREGFEPSRGLSPLHDFQSCLFSQLQHLSTFIYHIMACLSLWRRGWDLNPRDAQAPNGFRDRHIRPLCHLSKFIYFCRRALKKSRSSCAHSCSLMPAITSPTEWFKRSSCTRFISEETASAFGSEAPYTSC